jgi:hypothetical protein
VAGKAGPPTVLRTGAWQFDGNAVVKPPNLRLIRHPRLGPAVADISGSHFLRCHSAVARARFGLNNEAARRWLSGRLRNTAPLG